MDQRRGSVNAAAVTAGRRVSTVSANSARMPSARLSAIFPSGVGGTSWPANSNGQRGMGRVSMSAAMLNESMLLEDDIVPPMPGSSLMHHDFSRPILSQKRDSASDLPFGRTLSGGSGGVFHQLLASVASEHEREVSALKEQVEVLRRQKARSARNSAMSVNSELMHEEVEPPTDSPAKLLERLLEKPPKCTQSHEGEKHAQLLEVPGVPQLSAPPNWRPSMSDVSEHSSQGSGPPSRDGSEPGAPCQVIKVMPEPAPISLRVGVRTSLQMQNQLSDAASSMSPTTTGGMYHHASVDTDASELLGPRKFTIRVVWEQLSEEAHNHGHHLSKKLSVDSLRSDLTMSDSSFLMLTMSRIVAHPSSRFRLIWNFLAFLMLFSDLVTVPLQLFDPPENDIESVLAIITLIFWNLDIAANFMVGYWDKGAVVLSPRRIARHYMLTWLMPDLCLVSLDWVVIFAMAGGGTASSARASKVVRVLRTLRYLRLVRLLKTKQMLAKTQVLMSEISSVRFSIGKLVVAILIINHLIGCFWWGVGTLECEGRSWTYEFRDYGLPYRYLTSFHWSMSQFGVGNVEIEAVSTCERVFCIFVLLFALIAFSSLVSSITNAMAHLRRLNDRETQLALFSRYCFEQRISNQLMYRMIQHVNAVLDQQRQSIAAVDVAFLKLLSEPLFEELQKEIYEPYLRVHPFFSKLCAMYLACTRSLCRHTLTTMFLAPRDLLFHPCQVAHRMYFVEQGTLKYTRNQGQGLMSVTEVTPPEWFGEAVLWTRWMYFGHMQALEPCELVALGSEQFCEVIKMHPEVLRVLKRYARKFVERLNQAQECDLTDLSTDRNTTPFMRLEKRNEPGSPLTFGLGRCWSWSRFRSWRQSVSVTKRGSDNSSSSMSMELDQTGTGSMETAKCTAAEVPGNAVAES